MSTDKYLTHQRLDLERLRTDIQTANALFEPWNDLINKHFDHMAVRLSGNNFHVPYIRMQDGIRGIQKLLNNVDKLAEEQQDLREHWRQQELEQKRQKRMTTNDKPTRRNTIDWNAVLHAVDTAHGDLEYAKDCVDEYRDSLVYDYEEVKVLNDGVSRESYDRLVDLSTTLSIGMDWADKCCKHARKQMRPERRRAL